MQLRLYTLFVVFTISPAYTDDHRGTKKQFVYLNPLETILDAWGTHVSCVIYTTGVADPRSEPRVTAKFAPPIDMPITHYPRTSNNLLIFAYVMGMRYRCVLQPMKMYFCIVLSFCHHISTHFTNESSSSIILSDVFNFLGVFCYFWFLVLNILLSCAPYIISHLKSLPHPHSLFSVSMQKKHFMTYYEHLMFFFCCVITI